MKPPIAARITLALGATGLLLSIWNQWSAPQLDPALERASVLASLLAVLLLLIGSLWTRIVPEAPQRQALPGEQGLVMAPDLPEPLRLELAWGSQMLLTATPAAVVCLHWQGRQLLRRGLLDGGVFEPGAICSRAGQQQRPISLVDLKLYPGRDEFAGLLSGVPSVLVQPLGEAGVLVLGGWAPRCFSKADLAWVEGWGRRIRADLEAWCADAADRPPSSPAPSAG
jgi:hypothetical protein